jgi:hypothetical protein
MVDKFAPSLRDAVLPSLMVMSMAQPDRVLRCGTLDRLHILSFRYYEAVPIMLEF